METLNTKIAEHLGYHIVKQHERDYFHDCIVTSYYLADPLNNKVGLNYFTVQEAWENIPQWTEDLNSALQVIRGTPGASLSFDQHDQKWVAIFPRFLYDDPPHQVYIKHSDPRLSICLGWMAWHNLPIPDAYLEANSA